MSTMLLIDAYDNSVLELSIHHNISSFRDWVQEYVEGYVEIVHDGAIVILVRDDSTGLPPNIIATLSVGMETTLHGNIVIMPAKYLD